jgi:hypothetical protein
MLDPATGNTGNKSHSGRSSLEDGGGGGFCNHHCPSNHFEPLSPDANAGATTTDDHSIGKQLGELREEVRSLHEDVKKLIEIMETEELQKRVLTSRQSFDQLRSLQLQNAALKSQSAPEVAQFYGLRGVGSQTFEALAPLGVRRKSEQRRNLQLKILKEEHQLRSQMALPPQDGRLITPVDE